MMTQAQNQAKKLVAGTLLIASGVFISGLFNAQSAKAMEIGGGGTCTPHEVTYEQYIPGHYNGFNNWIPSHYETRSRLSTECNNPNPPIQPSIVNLSGNWHTNRDYSNAPTYIAQEGASAYLLTNEQGSTSNAYVLGNRIFAPQWQVNGYLENNNQVIRWSNGTTWSRYLY